MEHYGTIHLKQRQRQNEAWRKESNNNTKDNNRKVAQNGRRLQKVRKGVTVVHTPAMWKLSLRLDLMIGWHIEKKYDTNIYDIFFVIVKVMEVLLKDYMQIS